MGSWFGRPQEDPPCRVGSGPLHLWSTKRADAYCRAPLRPSKAPHDPLSLVAPAPLVRAALQVHTAQPAIDAAQSDFVLGAGQYGTTGVGQRDDSLKQRLVVSQPAITQCEQRW